MRNRILAAIIFLAIFPVTITAQSEPGCDVAATPCQLTDCAHLLTPCAASILADRLQDFFALFAPSATLEDWLVYPMLSGNLGDTGSVYDDLSLDNPRPVRLAFLDDGYIIAESLGDLLIETAPDDQAFPRWLVLERAAAVVPIYSAEFGADSEPGSFIRLDFTDEDAIMGVEVVDYWEGAERLEFMLARADDPDPRLQFMRCEGAAISRLEIGGRGRVSISPEDTLPIRDYPPGTANGQLDTGTAFTVLDGPTCFEDSTWWQIRTDDGRTGWISESDGLSYNAFPLEDNHEGAS